MKFLHFFFLISLFVLLPSPSLKAQQKKKQEEKKKIIQLLYQRSSGKLGKQIEIDGKLLDLGKKILPTLRKILKSPNPKWKYIKKDVVSILGMFYDEESSKTILQLAKTQYSGEFSYQIQVNERLYQTTIHALGRLRYQKSQDFLIQVLQNSQKFSIQFSALKSLESMVQAPPLKQELLSRFLKIFFSFPRHSLLQDGLGKFLEKKGFSPSKIPSYLPPRKAISLLGTYTSKKSLQILYDLTKKAPSQIQVMGLVEMGKRKAKTMLPFIHKSLFSYSIQVQKASLYAISMISDRESYSYLKKYVWEYENVNKSELLRIFLPILRASDHEMTDFFLSCMTKQDSYLNVKVLQALEAIKSPSLSSLAFPNMYSSFPELAIKASGMVARSGKKVGRKNLKKLFKKFAKNPRFLYKIAYQLARLGEDEGIQYLFDLACSSYSISGEAIGFLKSFHLQKITQKAISIYQKGGKKRIKAFYIIGGYVSFKNISIFMHALEDPSPIVRLQALQYLSQLKIKNPNVFLMEKVLQQLHHPKTFFMAQKISLSWKKKCFPSIFKLLFSTKNPNLISSLLFLLSKQETSFSPSYTSKIFALSYHSSSYIRGSSCYNLAKWKDQKYKIRLLELAEDKNFYVQIQAIRALGQEKNPYSLPVLLAGLKNSNLGVRIISYQALKNQKQGSFSYKPWGDLWERKIAIQKWEKWAIQTGRIK